MTGASSGEVASCGQIAGIVVGYREEGDKRMKNGFFLVTKIYTNVVFFTIVVAFCSAMLFALLEMISAASIILPIGTSMAAGLLSVALIFGRRQHIFTGWFAPLSVNAGVLFALAWVLLLVSIGFGGEAFMESIIQNSDPESTAKSLLSTAIGPILSSTIAVLSAFASREQDDDHDRKRDDGASSPGTGAS